MRRMAKLFLCALVFSCFIATSLASDLLSFGLPSARRKLRAIHLTQRWARVLLRVLRIKTDLTGSVSADLRGCLVVSNHQSYLDILVLVAHFPVQFVAKREVARWPLIGWMARLAGTLFIDRSSLRQSVRCADEVAAALAQGINVLVFPEGTSTNGLQVLPFKPMLLNAALAARAPVLPLTLNYVALNEQPLTLETRASCCWYGEMEFVSHFWRVLACQQITVALEIHPMFSPSQAITAHELARLAHEKVAHRFTTPPPTTSTTEALDTPDEFLLGALLLSLITHETDFLKEDQYGET